MYLEVPPPLDIKSFKHFLDIIIIIDCKSVINIHLEIIIIIDCNQRS